MHKDRERLPARVIAVAIPLLTMVMAGCVADDLDRGGEDPDIGATSGEGTIMAFARSSASAEADSVGDIEAVVSRVEAHAEASATAADGTSSAESSAASSVLILQETKTVSLDQDEDFIAQAEAPAGVFRSLVIVIDELRVDLADEDCEVVLALGGLRITIHGNFIVEADEVTQVLVELDAARAVVESGELECPTADSDTGGDDGFDADVTVQEKRVDVTNININVVQTLVVVDVDVTNRIVNDFDEDEAVDANDTALQERADEIRASASASATAEATADADGGNATAGSGAGSEVEIGTDPDSGNETDTTTPTQTIEV